MAKDFSKLRLSWKLSKLRASQRRDQHLNILPFPRRAACSLRLAAPTQQLPIYFFEGNLCLRKENSSIQWLPVDVAM